MMSNVNNARVLQSGDRVRCIDNADSCLLRGIVYTVGVGQLDDGSIVSLVGFEGAFLAGRFELATEVDERVQPAKPGADFSEVIVWKLAEETQPDDGAMVLLNVAPYCGVYEGEPVWPGYLEGGTWFWADGSEVASDVVAYAEMPVGLPTG
jgi:hypothetical protein